MASDEYAELFAEDPEVGPFCEIQRSWSRAEVAEAKVHLKCSKSFWLEETLHLKCLPVLCRTAVVQDECGLFGLSTSVFFVKASLLHRLL